ncbi:MAG: DUF523 domain-containing protein [Bacillota bacterium]|nr:DUF523 domain-containing protein [Bacillota bacterium]MDW7684716.1 DUF523 domain-containing protein [Bacillota bacterium]
MPGRGRTPLLVSACLLGLNTKYDGQSNLNPDLAALQDDYVLIPVCPEQLGGLSTPRPAAEISGGDGKDVLEGTAFVKTKCGEDRTAAFLQGARETLKMAETLGLKTAVLKARSPSCGSGEIYNGSFSGGKKTGDGVCAALLAREGITVYSEENINSLKNRFENGDS